MTFRRALPLAVVVAALLAVAAIAAHGHPIGHSHGSGPAATFFDYVFTSFAIVLAVIVALFFYGLLGTKWSPPAPRLVRFNIFQFLAIVAASFLFGWLLLHSNFHFRPKQSTTPVKTTTTAGKGLAQPSPIGRRNAHFRWDEIAIVAALLAAAGVALFATRKTKPSRDWQLDSHEEVALALDESLDDLRTEPDVRRAIIAAYARMERALGAAGIPRRPPEAPFEYLSRALQSLDASAPAVTTLTELFERAKFSRHELGEPARDEAIAALVAVRDELRPSAVAAA